MDVGVQPHNKNVWQNLDGERDQIWAEAKFRWQMGETLYLPDELKEEAQKQQEEHREVSAREGLIMHFLEKPVPAGWQDWTLDQRQLYWNGNYKDADKLLLVPRDRVCAVEIWCECFNGYKKDMRQMDTREINGIIEAIPGWEKRTLNFGCYGLQRGFRHSMNA